MKPAFLTTLWLLGVTLLLLPASAISESRSIPWHSKPGRNLFPNPGLNTPSEWRLAEGHFCESEFDTVISRSRAIPSYIFRESCSSEHTASFADGVVTDGSIKMKPYDHSCSRPGMPGSIRLSVEPGKTYTFSAYVRGSQWPSFIDMIVRAYDANGYSTMNHFGSRHGTTRACQWQEVVFPFTTTEYEWEVGLHVRRNKEEPQLGGCVWLDDVYLGEGVVFNDPPSPKRQFESSKVKIDSLGNFYLKDGENTVPFFPIAIYGTHRREDYGIYKKQGFNTVMRAGYPWGMEKATDAGLYYTIDITRFALRSKSREDAQAMAAELSSMIRSVHGHTYGGDRRIIDNFLMYYWDNELLGDKWVVPETILRAIQSEEAEISKKNQGRGARQHPIYVLQGNFGVARSYDQIVDADGAPLIDVVGTYVSTSDRPHTPQRADALVVLDKISGQTAPASFGQINDAGNVSLTGPELRLSVYNILIAGGKAIGIFKDRYMKINEKLGVEYSLWWRTLPTLVDEINQLLPIIREPHWTEWQIVADADNLGIGTREHDGHGYIFVTNNNPYSVRTTFTIQGDAPQAPRVVMDYLKGTKVTTISDAQFQVTLRANATQAYKLTGESESSE